jgi:hypothetical protein
VNLICCSSEKSNRSKFGKQGECESTSSSFPLKHKIPNRIKQALKAQSLHITRQTVEASLNLHCEQTDSVSESPISLGKTLKLPTSETVFYNALCISGTNLHSVQLKSEIINYIIKTQSNATS